MFEQMKLIPPNNSPPLDKDFHPAVLANQYFRCQVKSIGVPYMTYMKCGTRQAGEGIQDGIGSKLWKQSSTWG